MSNPDFLFIIFISIGFFGQTHFIVHVICGGIKANTGTMKNWCQAPQRIPDTLHIQINMPDCNAWKS